MGNAARLKWRCRRGMRELDILLERYLSEQYSDANSDCQAAFEALLEMQDPVILGLLLGRETTDDDRLAEVVQAIRRYR